MSAQSNANNVSNKSSNAANSLADGVNGAWNEIKGAGDEARGSFNQFADSLGDKIAGRDHPLPSGNDNTGTIEQGEKERAQGRNDWNRASAEHNANKSTSTATGTAPSATTGQY